jgi:hypothetical protein
VAVPVAVPVAVHPDFPRDSQSTPVTLLSISSEADFSNPTDANSVNTNEKRSPLANNDERSKSGWRDLNPRPLAPQTDMKARPLLAIRLGSIRLRYDSVVGFPLSQA